jgi:hypothetical protein
VKNDALKRLGDGPTTESLASVLHRKRGQKANRVFALVYGVYVCLLIDGDCAGVVLAEASFEVDSSSGASVHSGGDYTLDALVVRHVQAVAYVV